MITGSQSFVMLGPPASGKGTQGRMLAEQRGLAYLSTGSRLRREVEKESRLGMKAKSYLDDHRYVPDELAIELVADWLREQSTHFSGWLLDGFPRSVPQAEALFDMTSVPVVILNLDVPVEELRQRVVKRVECPQCGAIATDAREICTNCGSLMESRPDDTEEGFRERYEVYQQLTIPALQYLRSRCEVLTIDGLGSRDEVAARIQKMLN
jgi:adenylate kinase